MPVNAPEQKRDTPAISVVAVSHTGEHPGHRHSEKGEIETTADHRGETDRTLPVIPLRGALRRRLRVYSFLAVLTRQKPALASMHSLSRG